MWAESDCRSVFNVAVQATLGQTWAHDLFPDPPRSSLVLCWWCTLVLWSDVLKIRKVMLLQGSPFTVTPLGTVENVTVSGLSLSDAF